MISLVVAQPRENSWGRKSEATLWRECDDAKKSVESMLGDNVTVLGFNREDGKNWYNSPLWMMARQIGLLSYADAVYFCKGWRDSAECRILHDCAVNFGVKKIIEPAGQLKVDVKDGTAKKELPRTVEEIKADLEKKGYRPLRRCDFLDTKELKAVFVGVNMYLTTGEEYTDRKSVV